ncbi:uncharacterized protein PV09_08802 [Verruconis gallopava]|uniref:C2H2-type domain-containing protein n=1 Tax=Verruconis gallopava TaxID=253628 RepID=A0A0D1YFH5_9PEZI|nr:uncharacterized protein PV09_08802 [Verruconis gallopava]KIV99496.1 hypothetical protein PV09_08802 [Verruconis gallopava]
MVMDFSDRHQQSQIVEEACFDVVLQLQGGSWNPRYSADLYPITSRSHDISAQGAWSCSDVPSGHHHLGLDSVDVSENEKIEIWSDATPVSLQNSSPPYFIGDILLQPLEAASSNLGTSDRIDQFVNDPESPWIPSDAILFDAIFADTHDSAFQEGLDSESYHFSDSGYQTQPQSSVTSQSYHGHTGDLSNLRAQIQNFDMASMHDSQLDDGSDDGPGPPDRTVTSMSKTSKPSKGGKISCKVCQKTLKCPSELKKHMLIHEKPHKCDVSGCSRTEGFGTVNDLNRHKASVHKILSKARKFQCAVPGCKTPGKIWPRLDNFKQHLERMHKDFNVTDMIAQSEAKAASSSNIMSIRAMDNDLDGVGTGAGSNTQAETAIDSDDSSLHQHQTALFLKDPKPHCLKQITKRFGSALDQSAYSQCKRSDAAEVRQSLKSYQPNDHSRTLACIESAASHSLSATATLEDDANLRILKQVHSSGDGNSQHSNRSSNNSSDEESLTHHATGILCSYDGCKKIFKRKSELKKHLKRHTLPYVCTAIGCHHRSGSKSDWQRHERTCGKRGREICHDQSDTIRVCLELDPSSTTGKCGFVHTSQATFENHLKFVHDIKDKSTLQDLMLRYHPPDHGPGFGWCGFCVKTVQWTDVNAIGDKKVIQEGHGRYMDRANHIDYHVTKEGRSMEEYVSLEYHLKKEDATKDRLQRWFREEQRAPGHDPRISDFRPKNPKKRKRGVDGCGSSDDEHEKKSMRRTGHAVNAVPRNYTNCTRDALT